MYMIVWVFRSLYPNGTSIGSAVFAVVTVVSNGHTHRDHGKCGGVERSLTASASMNLSSVEIAEVVTQNRYLHTTNLFPPFSLDRRHSASTAEQQPPEPRRDDGRTTRCIPVKSETSETRSKDDVDDQAQRQSVRVRRGQLSDVHFSISSSRSLTGIESAAALEETVGGEDPRNDGHDPSIDGDDPRVDHDDAGVAGDNPGVDGNDPEIDRDDAGVAGDNSGVDDEDLADDGELPNLPGFLTTTTLGSTRKT